LKSAGIVAASIASPHSINFRVIANETFRDSADGLRVRYIDPIGMTEPGGEAMRLAFGLGGDKARLHLAALLPRILGTRSGVVKNSSVECKQLNPDDV
jgi:hypothetical protein